jgi:hypothetical protein
MSYDLMVFDPEAAPPTHDAFMTWYREQTQWKEEHGYNDPAVSAPKLRSWFEEMIKTFPPMNGPYQSEDVDDPKVSDYSVGRSVIYVAFAWSVAEEAHRSMRQLAEKHCVGFFDVSAENGEIWTPSASSRVQYMGTASKAEKPWWKFW